MKQFFFSLLISIVFGTVFLATDRYTSKFDNINVDQILNSKRLLMNYINCLLDKSPCSAEGRELKNVFPDAIATNCSKCNNFQKKNAGKVLTFVLLHYRNEWNQLVDKYDKDGNFKKVWEGQEDEDYSDLDEAKK